jgi:hypothetical protein
MSIIKTLKKHSYMFRSLNDHPHGTERNTVNKPHHSEQHKKLMNVCCRIAMFDIYEDSNQVILTRTKELPDDDHLMIETCRNIFKCFNN